MFLKTYNTEFDGIIITFIDQNDRLLKIEDKVILALLINKHKYAIFELSNATQEHQSMLKDMDFYHSRDNNKTITERDALKSACRKVVYETGAILGNKTADTVSKSNND